MRNILKTFTLWELLKGLGVTMRTFFRPKFTVYFFVKKVRAVSAMPFSSSGRRKILRKFEAI